MDLRNSFLRLSYDHDGDPNDDFGLLSVEVFAVGYSGRGDMWVQWQDLIELAEKLNEFPLSETDPPEGDWGYTDNDLYQSIVRLQFSNVGKTGPIEVLVSLTDDDDSDFAVKCKFEMGYPSLDRFRLELSRMAENKAGSAKLEN